MLFQTNLDIGNRACQHLGQLRMTGANFSDVSRQAGEIGFCYDKLRVAELRKTPWRFATRRAYLWPYTATNLRFIPGLFSAASVSYVAGQIVQDTNGVYWICTVLNTSSATNAPGTVTAGQPAYWQQYFGPLVCDAYSSAVTYNAGDLVYTGANPYKFYISLANAQANNTPASGAPWVNISGGTANTTAQAIIFPMPVGPSFTVTNVARNVFLLPNGFLRLTAPDPKQAASSFLAASAAQRFQDWQPEANYIVSASTTPILTRFVADLSDVPSMEPLFCEVLAASIAKEVCEPLTQSQEKFARVSAAYDELFAKAETVNLLEIGSTEIEQGAFDDDSNDDKFPSAQTASAQPKVR